MVLLSEKCRRRTSRILLPLPRSSILQRVRGGGIASVTLYIRTPRTNTLWRDGEKKGERWREYDGWHGMNCRRGERKSTANAFPFFRIVGRMDGRAIPLGDPPPPPPTTQGSTVYSEPFRPSRHPSGSAHSTSGAKGWGGGLLLWNAIDPHGF